MNDKDKEPVTIASIIAAVKKYEPSANTQLIQRAYDLAHAAHQGQTRVSGGIYYSSAACSADFDGASY